MIATKSINIHLSVEIINDDALADVTFLNNSSEIIYLDYWTIGMNKTLTNSVFSIRDENNKHVLYSGPLAYRKIVPDDFIALKPGESIKTQITINKHYKLVKGHTYKIFFCAYNPTFENMQSRMDLLSNKVEIIY